MSSEALQKALRYVATLPVEQSTHVRGLLVELWPNATLLAEKNKLLASLENQLATWEADKQREIARLELQVATLKTKNTMTKSKHAILASMRSALEVHVQLLYGPRMSLAAGLKEIAKECIVPATELNPKLTDEAKKMLQMLEGDCEIPGVADALLNLAEHLSPPRPQSDQGNGKDLAVRTAMAIALATAQKQLVIDVHI